MNRKTLVRLAGWLVAAISGAYFLRYAWTSLADKDLSSLLEPRALVAAAVLCALYMLLIPFTALAWTYLLGDLGEPARFSRLLPILATTQFGKYLPGNVAQHIGRVALLQTAQVKVSTAVLSLAYETLLILIACAHLSALTLLWDVPAGLAQWPLFAHRQELLVVMTGAAIAALVLAPRLVRWLVAFRANPQGGGQGQPHVRNLSWRVAIGCYLLYAANFLLVGVGMHLVAKALAGDAGAVPGIAYLTGAFASSWVLGFIAPGAPAGLGVREAILSAWLAATMPATQVVGVIVGLRIATTTGDLLNFAAGTLALRRLGSPARLSEAETRNRSVTVVKSPQNSNNRNEREGRRKET